MVHAHALILASIVSTAGVYDANAASVVPAPSFFSLRRVITIVSPRSQARQHVALDRPKIETTAPAPRAERVSKLRVTSNISRIEGVLPWEVHLIRPIFLELCTELSVANECASGGENHGG